MKLRYELAIFGAFLAFIAILIAVMYVDILAVLISAAVLVGVGFGFAAIWTRRS